MTGEPADGPGRWFWLGLVLGAPLIVVGIRGLLGAAAVSAPFNFALWFLGGALFHDLILAPVTLAVAYLLRRRVPDRVLATLQWAIVLTLFVAAFSLIPLVGLGRRSVEPTLQPLNYWLGLGIIVGGIWSAALGTALLGYLRHGRTRH